MAGRTSEASAMLSDTLTRAVHSLGPEGEPLVSPLQSLWGLLEKLGLKDEAEQLRSQAKELGCNVSCFVWEDEDGGDTSAGDQ